MLGRRVVPEVHRLTNRHNKIPHESGREVCLPLSRAKGGEVRKEDASWWRGWSRMIDGAFPPEYHSAIDQGPNHFWCCGGHGGRPDPSLHCGRPKDARGLRLLPDRIQEWRSRSQKRTAKKLAADLGPTHFSLFPFVAQIYSTIGPGPLLEIALPHDLDL